jgi:threonine/homoserine/homoserine lactone efflux protein
VSLSFLVTSFIVVAMPGTGVLLTVAAGLRSGPRRSLVTAVGCTLGIIPHLVAAITGAAVLLQASGLAFEVLKIFGVAYLLFMAWTAWRDTGSLVTPSTAPPAWSFGRTILTAVLANLLNPKLTIFFFAFLPQFISPQASHPFLDMVMLSAVFMLMTLVVFALYGLFASLARSHLIDRPAVVRRAQRAFSVAFLGLAGKLAFTSR